MPRYRDTQTGRVITVEGGDPTDEELDAMFADGGETFRMRASAPERTSTARPIPPGAEPSRGPLGGPNATLSPGEPESAVSRGYGAVKEAIFGHPDRAEAIEAGIGVQPTIADMGRTAVGLGATGLAGGAVMRGATALPGVAGAVARPVARAFEFASRHPVAAGTAAAGLDLVQGNDLQHAATEGLLVGAGAKSLGGRAGAAVSRATGVRQAAPRAVKAPTQRPQAVRSAPKKPPQSAPKAAEAPPAASEKSAPVVSRGKEVAARHNELMQFGKKIAAENPKVGEKIWILLDEAGKPVRMLTPDQAGAAARKGLATTWIRNLWERSATPARK